MERYKINRRVNKRLNKYYKFYNCDIWGRLGIKQKYDNITKLLTEHWKSKFSKELQRFRNNENIDNDIISELNKLSKEDLYKFFKYNLKKKKYLKRIKIQRQKGELLRIRKILSLFYGGGRIRKKTYRRYGKMTKHGISYVSILESRMDVLLFRANFVDTIYQAKRFVIARLARIRGKIFVNKPAHFIKPYEVITLRNDYWRNFRYVMMKKIMENRIISFPMYLYINFSIMLFFKMEEPKTKFIKYPFSETMNLAQFRHIFLMF